MLRSATAATGLSAVLRRCSSSSSSSSGGAAVALSRRPQHSSANDSNSNAPSLPALQSLLAAKSARLAALHTAQAACRHVAHRHPDRYMAGLFAFFALQAVVLFDWTFIHFDWNLTEPITYLLGYSATWVALAWYGNMQQEFGFDSLRELIEHRKLTALYRQRGIDVAKVARLEEEVERLARMVHGLAIE